MEKSIKTIWEESFRQETNLSAPKQEELYRKKSKLVIEKIKNTYKIANKSLIPFGILVGFFLGYINSVALGVYVTLLYFILFFYNKKLLSSLERININFSIYDYLVAYKSTVKEIMKKTSNLLTIGLPIAIFGVFWLHFRNDKAILHLIETTHTPNIIIAFCIAFICIVVVGHLGYWLETKLLYGKKLKKIDKMIEELKKDITDE